MAETGAGGEPGSGDASDVTAVKEKISELQRRKRQTVRWHVSPQTAERAIAAITGDSWRPAPGRGKSRRRKRHKRLL